MIAIGKSGHREAAVEDLIAIKSSTAALFSKQRNGLALD
jgi:hypothetical protein